MSTAVTHVKYLAKDGEVGDVPLHMNNIMWIRDMLPWIDLEDYLKEGMPVNYALMICHKVNKQPLYDFKYFLDGFSREECGCRQ